MKLSALDFSSLPDKVVEHVALCERLNCYERFWIGEHHSAGQVPDPLTVALLAAGKTERIRLGTGAISLIHRNPYTVAETALIGELFFPGRLDIGVTRSVADQTEIANYLCEALDHRRIDYDARVTFLRHALAREHGSPLTFLRQSVPLGPPLYVMGTFDGRARQAGMLGVGFCTSLHHTDIDNVSKCISAYQQSFKSSRWFSAPYAIVVVSGFVHHDVALVEEASKAPSWNNAMRVFATPLSAADRLREIGAIVSADEVMFLSLSPSLDSHRALAEGWTGSG
jgi:alkanesulfonate monooxygenase SsuD/methylene tetrahydromethanopterin reductase-like flavin-dependent oxidoreductase (luciferase family)